VRLRIEVCDKETDISSANTRHHVTNMNI